MNNCPNCSAVLSERPCPACGWPESTKPPPLTLEQQLNRARDLELAEEGPKMGCCGFFTVLVSGLIAYGCYQVGAANKWTSDGPAMLYVMLGFGVFGFFAVATAFALVFQPLARRVYLRITAYLPTWIRFLIE